MTDNSRIRWNPEERRAIAAQMAELLALTPDAHLLTVVRDAQERAVQAGTLSAARQREVRAWSVVQPKLQAELDEARAAMMTGSAAASATLGGGAAVLAEAGSTENAPTGQAEPAGCADEPAASAGLEGVAPPGSADVAMTVVQPQEPVLLEADGPTEAPVAVKAALVAPAAALVTAVVAKAREGLGVKLKQAMPEQATASPVTQDHATLAAAWSEPLETALIVALGSPAVQQALEQAFTQALSRAAAQLSSDGALSASAGAGRVKSEARPDKRILVAGFASHQVSGIEGGLGPAFDVRVWKQVQGVRALDTLAKVCPVAVIPEDSEDLQDALTARGVRVLTHTGSPQRLSERVQEAFEAA